MNRSAPLFLFFFLLTGLGCANLRGQALLSLRDTLLAPIPAAQDQLGSGVGLANGWLALGAPGDDQVDDQAGAVYLYECHADGTFQFQLKLVAPDGVINARFGASIAMEGGRLVVGAPQDSQAGQQAGAAYIFERDEGGPDNWGFVAKLVAGDPAPLDYYGTTIALWDTLLLVGRPNEPFGPLDDGGSAYLYTKDQGGPDIWGLVRQFGAFDPGLGDTFGAALALNGTTVVIGSPFDGSSSIFTPGSGSAYYFSRDQGGANAWGLVAKIQPSSLLAGDRFGASIAVSDSLLLIGAPGDDTLGSESGLVWVFERDSLGLSFDSLAQVVGPLPSADDQFGQTLLLRNDTLFVGAPGEDAGANDAGAIYRFSASSQTHTGTTSFLGAQASLEIGTAMASDGLRLVAGVPRGSYGLSRQGAGLLFDVPNPQPNAPAGPFNLYPNPTEGLLTLDGAMALPLTVLVYSADGRPHLAFKITTLPTQLRLNELAEGLYLLRLEGADGSRRVVKIVVE